MAATNYTPISLYYGVTAGVAPTAGNLVNGELAINITDGKLYYKDNAGAVQTIASKAIVTNGVTGPASSTDNAVARFDGTSGKIIQNSAVTIADTTGDITGGKYNGLTVSTTTGTFTLTNAKTLAVQNSLTLAGTDSTTMTFPSTSQSIAGLGAAQTWTAAQTFRTTSGTRFEEAATQDAIIIDGRAGGTSSYAITVTPAALSSSTTLTLPNVTSTVAVLGTAQTFTAAQTFRAANAVRSEAASTQDAMVLAGRAGGTGSYAVTLTPNTLSANRTVTFPDGNITMTAGTMAVLGTAQTFTAAQTFRAASSVRAEAAATQDAVVLAGRAGGTSSYAVTLTPTTLSANRTLTLPDSDGTIATTATAVSTGKSIAMAMIFGF